MRRAIVAFALGVWALERQRELPPGAALAIAAGIAAIALWAATHGRAPAVARRAAIAASCAVLGFCWAGAMAQLRMADRLDAALEGRDVTVTGVIAELPQPVERGARFDFDVESAPPGVPSRVQLSWYNGLAPEEFQEVAPVRAGERWRFTVRLRRPRGNANPHGFDYEAWLLERGTGATGYVTVRGDHERLAALVHRPSYWVERVRERVREHFWDALAGERFGGILTALAIGDQRAIGADDWQVFARTGVSHLMSISGLHVTMVAGIFGWLVFQLWRRSERLALALPAQKAAAAAAFLGALAYCLLSGFAVPAQRTLYMVGVAALALWTGRTSGASRVLALALAVVLVLDPWAVLSPGFWLSFGAVAVIFYVASGRVARGGWLAQWAAVQWAVTVGLAPLTLVLFQQVSLVSPLANAAAIPLVSFVITPLALAGAVVPFEFPLHLASWLLEWMMRGLEWLATLDGAVWRQHAPVAWTVPLAPAGVAWMLLPRGVPARALGVVMMLPLFAVKPPSPAAGEVWLTLLDVGQGLAVVARTRDHVLLYDTGPQYGEADAGSRVVLPYLRGEGIAALDALVVSHDDRDHSGGARSVLEGVPVAALWSSLPRGDPLAALAPWRLPCRAGAAWRWDGVEFRFVYPTMEILDDPLAPANRQSCVLRITAASGSVLLAGDIDKVAERRLLKADAGDLRADALVVPHHGSTTSSTPEFVRAVAPRWALFAVGWRNRFGHPREAVLERYREAGSAILRSDEAGAVSLGFGASGVRVEEHRASARRYWNDEPASVRYR
jgi:competence protein ComEC